MSAPAFLSFFSVYVIWGSTYLAIRYALETLPALALSSTRFLAAALMMLLIAVLRGEARLSRPEARTAALSGALLIIANGFVCIVEYWVPSGLVAVLLGATPIWVLLVGWLSFHEKRPTLSQLVGAFIGLGGVTMIASGPVGLSHTESGALGVGLLFIASLMWTIGTFIQRRGPKTVSLFRFSAVQMLVGGLSSTVLSLVFEKPWTVRWHHISSTSFLAWLYLVIFGSVIAFTAYAWLVRNVAPSLTSSYALVNPVIAVVLGWWVMDEPVTPRFVAATALVILGLALLMDWHKHFFARASKVGDPPREA